MKLRATIPKDRPRRLKLLLFGPAGVGKTTAAIQMPKPYILDAERGTDHYGELIEASGGAVFQTTLMAEVVGEIRSLTTEEHPYRTLVLDPVTPLYQDLVDECEKRVGSEWGRHYGEANKAMKRLANLMMALDLNVIVTAHAKPLYSDAMKQVGQTFDGWKRLDYLFDLVLELERRGNKRVARVVKSRIAAFPDGDTFEWSYDAIADRYGRDILEKQATTVQLATDEHVRKFECLLVQLSDVERHRLNIDRALRGVDNIADLPDERLVRGIELMQSHLQRTANNSQGIMKCQPSNTTRPTPTQSSTQASTMP